MLVYASVTEGASPYEKFKKFRVHISSFSPSLPPRFLGDVRVDARSFCPPSYLPLIFFALQPSCDPLKTMTEQIVYSHNWRPSIFSLIRCLI